MVRWLQNLFSCFLFCRNTGGKEAWLVGEFGAFGGSWLCLMLFGLVCFCEERDSFWMMGSWNLGILFAWGFFAVLKYFLDLVERF